MRARCDCRNSTAGMTRAVRQPLPRLGLVIFLSPPVRIKSSKKAADSTA